MVNENQKAKAVISKSVDILLAVVLIVLGLLMFAIALIVANEYAYRVSVFDYIGINIELYVWFFVAMALCITAGILILVFKPIQKKYSLTVTDKRVFSKTLLQTVELPLNKITVVSQGIFKHITIATARGRITFYFVANVNEVVTAIEEQIHNK